MGLIYAFITVVMHAEQGISGIGIYLLAWVSPTCFSRSW